MVQKVTPDKIKENHSTGQSTLGFLLRRIKQATDLPAFSHHIKEINEKTSPASRNYASASELANTILKDYSLTNKLLRLVNSVYYGQRAGKVTTITRAVVVLGFEQVRLAASSILLFEHLRGESFRGQLKEEVVGAILAGLISREIAAMVNLVDLEEVFICSMLHNLGKILVIYYLPEDYQRIQSYKSKKNTDDGTASRHILGISYGDLGRGIAQAWKFPDKIVNTIQESFNTDVPTINSEEDTLAKLALFSNELCDLFKYANHELFEERIQDLLKKYSAYFPLSKRQLSRAIEEAVTKFTCYSRALELSASDTSLIGAISLYSATKPKEYQKDLRVDITLREEYPDHGKDPASLLIAGIEDVSSILTGKYAIRDLLTTILETMYRGFGFYRVILMLLNRSRNKMIARLGFGPDIEETIEVFRFPLDRSKDIFNLALSIGKDIRIDDTKSPEIAKRIPLWYKESIYAPALILFPVICGGKAVGLFYADKNATGKVIDDAQLDYMRTLRNQAALAISNHGPRAL